MSLFLSPCNHGPESTPTHHVIVHDQGILVNDRLLETRPSQQRWVEQVEGKTLVEQDGSVFARGLLEIGAAAFQFRYVLETNPLSRLDLILDRPQHQVISQVVQRPQCTVRAVTPESPGGVGRITLAHGELVE